MRALVIISKNTAYKGTKMASLLQLFRTKAATKYDKNLAGVETIIVKNNLAQTLDINIDYIAHKTHRFPLPKGGSFPFSIEKADDCFTLKATVNNATYNVAKIRLGLMSDYFLPPNKDNPKLTYWGGNGNGVDTIIDLKNNKYTPEFLDYNGISWGSSYVVFTQSLEDKQLTVTLSPLYPEI